MVLEQYVLWPTGLWALLGIIPLLLLYLLKPKPRKQTLPSLMFLLGDKGQKSRSAWLWYMLSDLLFFLQLLILLGLAITIAQPYLLVNEDIARDNTVIILDTSASMNAPDNNPRWQEARNIAKDNLGSSNTLILAGGIPEVIYEDASASEVRAYLDGWQASDQPTNLGRAILRARDAAGPDSRVLVISDFRETDQSTSWQKAISTLQARGIAVRLRQVGGQARNVGIVDAVITEATTTIFVRNYQEQDITVPLCVAGTCRDLDIEAYSTEQLQIQTPSGQAKAEIDYDDDYRTDNEMYLSMPEQQTVRALVVTNGNFQESSLRYALDTINEATPLNIEVTVNNPPDLISVDHDLIIYTEVDENLLVSRVIRETIERVEQGGAAIIIGQQNVFALPYDDLFAVTWKADARAGTVTNTQTNPSLLSIDYGDVTSHYETELIRSAEVFATVDGSPIITLNTLGRGRVLYHGLDPQQSTFNLNPQYPVYWKRTIDLLLQRPSAASLNKKTGELLNAQTIERPDGTTTQGTTIMDQQGFYKTPAGVIAANTLSTGESNINTENLEEDEQYARYQQTTYKEPKQLTEYFIYALLALLLIEILYVKWRGDA